VAILGFCLHLLIMINKEDIPKFLVDQLFESIFKMVIYLSSSSVRQQSPPPLWESVPKITGCNFTPQICEDERNKVVILPLWGSGLIFVSEDSQICGVDSLPPASPQLLQLRLRRMTGKAGAAPRQSGR
jgi:hypothetical protein